MAYNPAAPAAPEAIKHREKTPPPDDGAPYPLVAAAASDHGQTYSVPFQHPGGFPGPPIAPAMPPPPSQPPASAPLQSPYAQYFQHSFAPPPTAPTVNSSPYDSVPAHPIPGPPAYTRQPQTHILATQYANFPGSPSISPGLTTPTLSFPSIHAGAAPPGGFAQFNYNNGMNNPNPLMMSYSVHQQVYRPTENEAIARNNKGQRPPRARLEERAGHLEKTVNGFIKKIEKRIG